MMTMSVWATAKMALPSFFVPKRRMKRRYWADRYVLWPCEAAQAASRRAVRRASSPLRPRPDFRLPADSWLPGQSPAQGRQVGGAREAGHVDADLGDDHLSSSLPDAGDGRQRGCRFNKRGHQFVHFLVQAGDHRGQFVDVVEVHAGQEGVVVFEAPDEGLAEPSDLGPHPGEAHVGEDLGVSLAGDEGLDHPARRFAGHVGDDRLELDLGVFQQLLEALYFPGPLPHEPRAVAG